ncbi:MAG TPA: PhzF family phenazine biosynthesis protein, partial [Methylomirabilota bacterium]|nr:PhzF family phenazine biosynthesis protein [Methylomirabilota bacterium]
MRVPLTLVDAFTDTPFAGNPAAVCLLEAPRDDGWMQAVAAEMNLPATAFVRAAGDGLERAARLARAAGPDERHEAGAAVARRRDRAEL